VAHGYQFYNLFLIDSYLEICCLKCCSFSRFHFYMYACSVAVYMSCVNVTQSVQRSLIAFSIAHTWQSVIALGIRHNPEIWCTYTPITALWYGVIIKGVNVMQELWLAKLGCLKRLYSKTLFHRPGHKQSSLSCELTVVLSDVHNWHNV